MKTRRLLCTLLALACLTGCSQGIADIFSPSTGPGDPGPSTSPIPTPTPGRDCHYEKDPVSGKTLGYNTKLETEVARLTNVERARVGRSPLKLVSYLNVAAQKHALNMALKKDMSHSLDGKSAEERINDTGYRWNGWAENIAEGYTSAASTMAGWMGSPGHQANILDSSDMGITQIGVGVARAADGTLYYCQVFARPANNTDYE